VAGPSLSSVVDLRVVHKDGDGPWLPFLHVAVVVGSNNGRAFPSIEPDMHSRHMLIRGSRLLVATVHPEKTPRISDGYACVWRSSFTELFFHRSRGSAGELRVDAFVAALLSSHEGDREFLDAVLDRFFENFSGHYSHAWTRMFLSFFLLAYISTPYASLICSKKGCSPQVNLPAAAFLQIKLTYLQQPPS
jgi:hypothetical protein